MISRIYITPKVEDIRGNLYAKSFQKLGLHGKIKNVQIVDSYLISHNFSKEKIAKIAEALTNPILEKFSINKLPNVESSKSGHVLEIGFLPGVTDNIGNTTKETISDLFHLSLDVTLAVYTSKVFLISGSIKLDDIKKIALSLHNPLIERSYITHQDGVDLPLKAPEVILKKTIPVIKVPLSNTRDEKLEKIGKIGVMDDTGVRRGPLALTLPSMKVIQAHFAKLKREPTDIEIESLAQTWSEHCKHTIFANPIDDIKDGLYKTYIKGATNLIRKQKGKNDFCVSVFSDNSGGIIFDNDYLITHKVETHNSPSALDPFGGAITGIVGVNRDTIGFGLGAKPIANCYGFCLGNPDDKQKFFKNKDKNGNLVQEMLSPKRIMNGVIKGINVGGNCSGIPTLSGFLRFDDRYRAKPLVFAGTVGLIPRNLPASLGNKRPSHLKKAQSGDLVVMVGGRVGLDGVHGATFSSVVMDSNSPATAVQIGDPITQKKLSDAIIKEARDMDLYTSITDNGAGGLSCSVAEMAKECGGVEVTLEKVPLKYPGLRPWEIWISESQERMTLSVPKEKWKAFYELMQRRGVEATVIGNFTNSGKCIVKYNDEKIMDLDMEFLHDGLPKNHLTTNPTSPQPSPEKREGVSSFPSQGKAGDEVYTKVLEKLLAEKNVSGFSFISEQYDHEVQASSVLKPISGRGRINTDAQVFRPVLNSNKGVVLSSSVYPSYGDISTYHMAACAIDTAVRNAVAAGGKLSNLAILDNFCWCSSYDQKRLAQLVDSLKACYEYAVGYGTPFISGKDSMFNDFKGYDEKGNPVAVSIPPTLLISIIGVMNNLYKTVSPEFKNSGDIIYLLGETNDELGESEYFKLLAKEQGSNAIGNNAPKVNLKENIKTYRALEKAIEKELVASSMSVTSGGLGIALAKACVGGMVGCKVSLNKVCGSLASANTVDAKLFSESQGRILVSVSPKNILAFEKIMKNISYVKLGKVTKDNKLIITEGSKKVAESDVKKLYKIYHSFSEKMK